MSSKWNSLTSNFDIVNDISTVVVGPGSSSDNALARFDGTSGYLLQNSNATLTDAGALSLAVALSATSGGLGHSSYVVGDLTYASSTSALSKLGIGSPGQVLTVAAGIPSWAAAAAGGDPPPKVYWFAAESLQPLETNSAAILKLAGSNVKIFVRAFDTSTEEFANGKLEVPADVSTTGTDLVTFRAYVMASTAAASKNVKLTFGHRPLNTGTNFDQSYTDVSVDDQPIDATQDNITQIEWTASLTTLGWAAKYLVPFRFSREAATTNNLATDMYLFSLSITIPRV